MVEFETIYENFVQWSDFLETRRKIMLKSLYIKEIVTFILMLLSAFISYKLILKFSTDNVSYMDPFWGFFCVMFTFIILPCISVISLVEIFQMFRKSVKEFSNLVKNTCMRSIIEKLSLEWIKDKNAIKSLPLQISDIFPAYSYIEYDDTFCGKYNDIEFDVQEIELKMKGSKSDICKFKGIAICIPSNKTVKAHTIITSKRDKAIRNRTMSIPMMFLLGVLSLIFGIYALKILLSGIVKNDMSTEVLHSIGAIIAGIAMFYSAILQIKNERRLQTIKLEDPNFNKRFNVYSENQIEARYLVTTAFMDRLQNLQTVFGTKNIKCSFFDDKVMFAISTNKDLFELGNLFVPLTDKRQIETFYKELNSIYNIIDYFKLAEKTGL